MTSRPAGRGRRVVAAAIAALAIGLRFWRLGWGLEYQMWFPDEAIFGGCAARFVPLSWNSFDLASFSYGSVYGYLAGAITALAWAAGLLREPPNPVAPDTLLVTRAVSAVAGVATVWLAGRLATRMYSPSVGLAAAALVAVLPFHVMYAHLASTDVLLTGEVVVGLLAAWALVERPSIARAAAAGVVAGVTTATKYTGLALLAPIGWALLEDLWRSRTPWRTLRLGLVVVGALTVSFAVACPPCWLHAAEVRTALAYERFLTTYAPGGPNNKLVPSLGWYGRPYLYQLVASLPYSLGWPLYALALAGLGLALGRHRPGDRVLLAFVLPYFIVIGSYRLTFPRYLLPLLPGLAILAARAAVEPGRWRRAGAVVLGAVGLYSLALSVSQVRRFSWDQQRDVAAWTKKMWPLLGRPPRVAAPGSFYFRLGDAFDAAGVKLDAVSDGHWLDARPDVFVLPEWYAISIERDRGSPEALAELERLESGATGYRLAARWHSSYLQDSFYTRLDPAFAADLWQGEFGFTAWVPLRLAVLLPP